MEIIDDRKTRQTTGLPDRQILGPTKTMAATNMPTPFIICTWFFMISWLGCQQKLNIRCVFLKPSWNKDIGS